MILTFGAKKYSFIKRQGLSMLVATCVSCLLVYLITTSLNPMKWTQCVGCDDHSTSKYSDHNSLSQASPAVSFVFSCETPTGKEQSMSQAEIKQQADIVKWIDIFVKSPDQLSIWNLTTSLQTHNLTQQKVNPAIGSESELNELRLTEYNVPGLFLHSNWHWTFTKRGEFDPGLYSPPEGELPTQRLPKAIIIGAGTCGTRALLEFLNLHPNIVAESKEMNFFSDKQILDRGLTWYRASMPLSYSNQITIEKSPAYFVSWEAPAEIFNMDKFVKLILVVKDPVQRILTQAGKVINREHDANTESHEQMYLNTKGSTVEVRNDSRTVIGGLYAHHLERWLNYFPLHQVHILEGGNLVSHPFQEVHKLETFLGVPHVISTRNFVYNATKGFYCLAPVYSPQRPKCLGDSKGVQHPRLQPRVSQLLYDFYRPHNKRFFAMIGRKFNWEQEQFAPKRA